MIPWQQEVVDIDGFIDQASRRRVGLDWVMERLHPLSCYGLRRRERMPVYLPGCEAQLNREWDRLVRLLALWEQAPGHVQELETAIHGLQDIRGIVRKACLRLTLEEHELFDVKQWLLQMKKLARVLELLPWDCPRGLQVRNCPQLLAALSVDGDAGFYLSDKYDTKLGQLRREQREKRAALAAKKQAMREKITRATGLEFNHQGCLRVGKHDAHRLRALSKRLDLLIAAESYTEVEFMLRETGEMLEAARDISVLEQDIQQQEFLVRQKLTLEVAKFSRELLASCNRAGIIDLLLAKARLAREIGRCRPRLAGENKLVVRGLVHPWVARHLHEQGLEFQPVDVAMASKPITLITGANMGGKSVTLKAVGLVVSMAQLGLLVPAKSMEFSLRGFVYYSQQDEEPQQGLSTFGAEIHSLARVLPRFREPGLYLLDEPARGTNPQEGGALVAAIITWLSKGNSLALVATHFPGMASDSIEHLQVAGLSAVRRKELDSALAKGLKSLQQLMDYSLVPSTGEVPRDALKVAAFLGLDREIICLASQQLGLLPQEVMEE